MVDSIELTILMPCLNMIIAVTTLVAGIQLAMSAFMSSIIDIPLSERRVQQMPVDDHMLRRGTDRPGRKKA